jgi:hypothetical protein
MAGDDENRGRNEGEEKLEGRREGELCAGGRKGEEKRKKKLGTSSVAHSRGGVFDMLTGDTSKL